jgi:hypothetical protein
VGRTLLSVALDLVVAVAFEFVAQAPATEAQSRLRSHSPGATIIFTQEVSMINGTHVVLYTKDPEADRAFFRDVLQLPSVDAGHGWLIFALPPAEAAFHDAEHNDKHELYLMCDDIAATLRDLKKKKVPVSDVNEQRWGTLATLTLPGGGKVGIYQPKHPRPPR